MRCNFEEYEVVLEILGFLAEVFGDVGVRRHITARSSFISLCEAHGSV